MGATAVTLVAMPMGKIGCVFIWRNGSFDSWYRWLGQTPVLWIVCTSRILRYVGYVFSSKVRVYFLFLVLLPACQLQHVSAIYDRIIYVFGIYIRHACCSILLRRRWAVSTFRHAVSLSDEIISLKLTCRRIPDWSNHEFLLNRLFVAEGCIIYPRGN